MTLNALRNWGMGISGALMAGLIVFALQPAPQAEAQPQAVYEVAQTQGQAAPLAFIVRFQGSGPIARAQAEAARGRTTQAGRVIEAQLLRQTAFAGLCFDRFTIGGAETVLRTCEDVPAHARAALQQQWLARLQAMRAVDYVDANANASQERAG